jgi:hypothetical protein
MISSAKTLKRLLNLYPPYLGAGVKITYSSDDWKEMHVSMSLRWYNKNAVNTHFGGSLYSMVDPHIMLMLLPLLGKEYLVWDKAADIEFIRASKKPVSAKIKLTDNDITTIKAETAGGKKYLPEFFIDINDDQGLVARVKKTLYVKKK